MTDDRARYIKYCIAAEKVYRSIHSLENPTPEQVTKLNNYASSYAYPPNLINRTDQFIHFDEHFGIGSLEKNVVMCLTELPDLPLVVILDPLYLMVGGHTSDEYDMRKLFENIDLLKSRYPFTPIIVHHSRKAVTDESGLSVDKGSQDMTGTRGFPRWVDTVVRLDIDQNNSRRVEFSFTKHRNAEVELPHLELKWNRDTLHCQVTKRWMHKDPKEEEEIEIRGELDYHLLDGG